MKRRLVVDAAGGPLGATSAGAHGHAPKRPATTLEAIVGDRPPPSAARPPHLCGDKGDDPPTGHETVAASPYPPHLRRLGEEQLDPHGEKTPPARRGVGERTLAWLATCRGLLVRYEKKALNGLGLLQLACALSWMRRRARLLGE